MSPDAGTGAIIADRDTPPAAPEEWSLLALMEPGEIGRKLADGTFAVDRDERPVCLLFGPFWRLAQGHYRLRVDCLAGTPKTGPAPVLGVEILAENRVQVAWRDFTATELAGGAGEIAFTVSPELSHDAGGGAIFEFRLLHLGNADLIVSGLVLQRSTGEMSGNWSRRWRLFGQRDWRRASRPDTAGFVTVPRWAPPGQFLRRVGVFGGVPAGRYRLRFGCRVGAPRRVRQPVLGVEVVNGRLTQQNFFYAAGLTSGSGAIDFAVPAAESLEGGASAPLVIRFLHRGNAALAVGAIELTLIAEGEASQPADELPRPQPPDGSGPRGRLMVDPLRLPLPPGQVKVELFPPVEAGNRGAGASLRLELRQQSRLSQRFRRGFRRRDPAAPTAGGWRGISQVTPLGRCAIEFGIDQPETEVELRVAGDTAADRSIGKISIRQHRRERQKELIIVGNCHAAVIYEGFRAVPALQHYFRARYHNVNLPGHFYAQARRDVEDCDLLVVQDVADWEDCALRQWVPAQAQVIMFPCVRFASLWPFDGCNGPTDQAAIDREAPNLTFTYHDGLLARLRREVPDPDRRFQVYRSLAIDGVVNYVRAHEFESRRMLALDRKYECQIGSYILDRFRDEQLFYTTNHPNRRLFEMLIGNIMRSLGVSGEIPPIAALDQLRTPEVPVHPEVALALGVRWATPERRYRFRQEALSWEEYVRRYIAHYG